MVAPNNPAGKTPTAEDAKELRDPDVKLCPAVLTASFDAFLAGLAKHPADDDLADLFSDWLDAQGPTPVRPGRLPTWLRRSWLRAMPRPAPAPGRRLLDREIDTWLAGGHLAGALDHWGSTTVCGRTAFVNEPYRERAEVLGQCRRLALVVGGIAVACRRSAWGHGTVRGLIFPPPR